jgi:predicted AlkP superfamily pyrophosphatase or phosphodiesterase
VLRRAALALIACLPVVVALGVAAGPADGRAPPSAPPARHVIILSLDGARADALRAVWTVSLRERSAASWSALTTLPSSTLPSHTSMVTGVGPQIHGVGFNDWRPGQKRLALPTIFTEVRRHGGAVHLLVAKPKLRFLVPEEIPFDHLAYPRYRQADVMAAASRLFSKRRPALLFVHMADADDAGHRYAWMSPRYLAAIEEVPRLIDGLLQAVRAAGVWDQTLVIVTADHGGHGRTHGTAQPEDVMIPWVALGGVARGGVLLERRIMTYDTAATALFALGLPVPEGWQGRPVMEALRVQVPATR